MDYTLEEVYQLVGKIDKISLIEFKLNSEAYQNFGAYVVMQAFYSQEDREQLDQIIKQGVTGTIGYIKGEYLGTDLSEDRILLLKTKGFSSEDILEIKWSTNANPNQSFHTTGKKTLNKIVIETNPLSDEGEQRFIFGYYKRFVSDGNELNPYERKIYLANKMLFDPTNISPTELIDIESDDIASKDIKFEFLKAKLLMNTIEADEKKEFTDLFNARIKKAATILKDCLQTVSINAKDALKNNSDFVTELFQRILFFQDKRINTLGKKAIYLDLDGLTHIFLKHVEEMKVNKTFDNKDNFLWNKEDVIPVMKKIINDLNDEIQKHFETAPTKAFFKNQGHNIYHQGDYYAFYIEPNGRVSNFHRLKKEFEKGN
jgi:hypothetical protein